MPAAARDADFSALTYQVGGSAVGDNPDDYGLGIGASGRASVQIDGTPSRVAGLLLLSGGVLAALRLAGFRFNVGVSS